MKFCILKLKTQFYQIKALIGIVTPYELMVSDGYTVVPVGYTVVPVG